MVRGDGQITVGPTERTKYDIPPRVGPLPAPEGFRPGEFNTLAVVRRGRELTLFLNGKQVGKPIAIDQPLGRCAGGLVGRQHGKEDVLVEFERYTVWELPSVAGGDGAEHHRRERPRLSVPGLKAVEILRDDDFEDPETSLFRPSMTNAAAAGSRLIEFAPGRYVMHFRSPGWWGWAPCPPVRGFVAQAEGRVSGQKECSWGIYVNGTPRTRAFKVTVRPDGQIRLTPTSWTRDYPVPNVRAFKTPEGFRPGDFNTLAVVRQRREITLFLNGKQLGTPILFERSLGMCSCGLMGLQSGAGEVRAEFARYTVWELPPP